MSKGPLKPGIGAVGQRYYDEPVRVNPVQDFLRDQIEDALKPAAQDQRSAGLAVCLLPRPAKYPAPYQKRPSSIVVDHRRVQLRWLEPDGKGGIKPKGQQ
jgi:hypothetical protein